MFVLEKLNVMEGKHSAVHEGYRQSSDTLKVFQYPDEKAIEITDIHDIKIGWQVLVGRGMQFLQTSPVKEIMESSPNRIVFKTQTSIYQLECIADDKDMVNG